MKITLEEYALERILKVEDLRNTEQVEEINLIMQTLEMLDEYKSYNSESMPGTITDLVEWNQKPFK